MAITKSDEDDVALDLLDREYELEGTDQKGAPSRTGSPDQKGAPSRPGSPPASDHVHQPVAPLSHIANNPAASILGYCLSSISMTVVNKYVVSGSDWNLMFLYLAIQVSSECPRYCSSGAELFLACMLINEDSLLFVSW